jgi:hypothetical protein
MPVPHERYRFACLPVITRRQLNRKLATLKRAGVDVDRLPDDMRITYVMKLTVDEANRVIAGL